MHSCSEIDVRIVCFFSLMKSVQTVLGIND